MMASTRRSRGRKLFGIVGSIARILPFGYLEQLAHAHARLGWLRHIEHTGL